MKRVKQFFSILLILGMLALPSGCNDQGSNSGNSDFNLETDMQYFYHKGISNPPITKSEDGYYYVGDDGIIIYVDKESLSATPLCFEPNCLHNNPETCNAYFDIYDLLDADYAVGGISTVIQYYKGKLYMVCQEYDHSNIEQKTYLLRCDKDGSNREKATEYFDKNFTQWLIHRGYFYYSDDKSVLRLPMDSLKSESEAVFTLENYKENNLNSFEHFSAYGNYLYFYANEYNKSKGSNLYQVSLNLDTLELKKLISDGISVPVKTFCDNKCVLFKRDAKNKETVYYKVTQDFLSSERLFKEASNKYSDLTCDGKYFYLDNSNLAYINNNNENFEQVITVYDLDFNEVDSFKLPQNKGSVFNYFAAQDEDYFLLDIMQKDGGRMLIIADKSQIGSIKGNTIEYKELCKLDWYENSDNPYVSYAE